MAFSQDVRDGIQRYIDTYCEGKTNQFTTKGKFDQGKLSKFLNMKQLGMNSDALGNILDFIGAKIVFPDEIRDRTKNCIFINTVRNSNHQDLPSPKAEDYKAVPLVDMPVAAGPGMLTDDKIRSWVMVYNQQHAVRLKTNLIAVEIGRGQNSMTPTLHPFDIVLVDMDDKDPGKGRSIFLIQEPDGSVAVKRVSVETRGGKTHVIFYSDNAQEYSPVMYILEDDYAGDITRAIVGKIIWSWSDMTQK